MNREETRKAAEVMLHYANGGEVQWRKCRVDEWESVVSPFWNWDSLKYRIKPQPVEIETWAVVDASGMVIATAMTEDSAVSYAHRCLHATAVQCKGTYTCDT